MLQYDDKRSFFRMIMNSPCELRVQGQDVSNPISAVCKDISAVGMSFEVGESIAIGTELSVSIDSNSAQIASLSAVVKVVREQKLSDSTFLVGVEIVNMT
ncbi:PilZ domain-containing protein [Paraneptunicella aestuarii]|uniref:PilZ domain-containing protein n=1 Tax=Paraneptunicella aestuarii TaxID=2831148 RepID=UPI001E5D7936|nr:PilZ domain-containing protein [Paraneptunicella aestuarii]UAA37236.1 PilZ domain-containing protein [Paraneptunicella aestuarii]